MAKPWGITATLARAVLAPAVGLRRTVATSFVEDFAGIALAVLAPLVLKTLVDQLTTRAPRPSGLGLTLEIGVFVLAWSSPNLLAALKLVHTTTVVERLNGVIVEAALHRHLEESDAGSRAASLITLLERTPAALQLILDGLIWRLLPLSLQTLATLATLSWLLPAPFVSILALTGLAYLVVATFGARRFDEKVQRQQQTTLTAATELSDLISHASRAWINGAHALEVDRLKDFIQVRRRSAETTSISVVLTISAQCVVLVVGVGAMLDLGVGAVIRHQLSLGGFVMAQAYAFRLVLPLGALVVSLRQARPAFETLSAVLQRTGPLPCPTPMSSPVPAPQRGAGVRVEGASFRHSGSDGGLHPMDLTIAAGAFVVIAGANGAGKSTLARLLAGQLHPQTGRVLIGGVDLAGLKPVSRSQLVLYVPQSPQLFNRTLRETGLYPPCQLSAQALLRRLRSLSFHTDDEPIDLDRRVGPDGGHLSGGQRQKLELARLSGTDPIALVLDESTSALDIASEHRALDTLRHALPTTALILVTHQPRLAAAADTVVHVHQGRLAGVGSHATLKVSNPAYRQLWESSDGLV